MRAVTTSGGLHIGDLSLRRPDGISRCNTGGYTNTLDMTCTLDTAGTHSIFLAAIAADIGDYTMTLARLNTTTR